MKSVKAIEAITKRGLKGDRYSDDRGHWKSIDGCQVTLITEHDLTRAKKGTGAEFQQALDNGSHRRNLVIEGLKTKSLEGKQFRIGTAVFRYDKPARPALTWIRLLAKACAAPWAIIAAYVSASSAAAGLRWGIRWR